MKHQHRRAKIIATLGPASSEYETIYQMVDAGMNVCRINMSHGTHEDKKAIIENLRKAAREQDVNVGVFFDLQGPKIRVDNLPEPIVINDDEEWQVGTEEHRNGDKYIPSVFEDFAKDCSVGDRLLFDDGLIHTKIIAINEKTITIKISHGGILKSKKGINLPDTKVSAPSFTKKDQEDLAFGVELGIEMVALSYVRRREDVVQVREFLKKHNHKIGIISKIENPEGLANLDEIIDVSDYIMVARGDMGVEIGNHAVPREQKRIIHACNERGIPVITATQMLESMIVNPSCTRAEATDIANAIWDGTDALMLSGETAAGKFPLDAIREMDNIIYEAEQSDFHDVVLEQTNLSAPDLSIAYTASILATNVKARKIICFTASGKTARYISRFRPEVPILAVTDSGSVGGNLSLCWGVTPLVLENVDETSPVFEYEVIEMIRNICELDSGDQIVMIKGDRGAFEHGSSNSMKIVKLKQRLKKKTFSSFC
jgi:pyruvate kinase